MIDQLLAQYGLLALFLGAGLEGEAVVMAGGLAARHGSFSLGWAMAAATAGSTLVDQLWFLAGRRYRNHPRIVRLRSRPRFHKAERLLERYPTAFILAFRFIYGMRTLSPIAIGLSSIPARRFVILNMIAAAIWAPLFTYIGFQFGPAILPLLRRFEGIGIATAGVIAIIIATIVWWHRQRIN